jgi:hypothetical protein
MIKIEYITEQPTKETCNSSNHHHLCPFAIDSTLKTITVDDNWWNHQVIQDSRQKLINHFQCVGYKLIVLPDVKNSNPSIDKNDIFWDIYLTFLHQFDAQYWLNSLFDANEFRMIYLTKSFIRFLHEKALLFNCGRDLKISSLLEDIESDSCWQQCCESLKTFDTCFVKLSQTSGKHDREVSPISTPEQLLLYLINSKTLLKCYQSFEESKTGGIPLDIYLIVKPWDTQITDFNEFRVFYYNHKITAISQQKWYSQINIPFHSEQMITTLQQKIRNLNDFPYSSCVFDVYFDIERNQTEFIEINPWGNWNASGSSLFHWVKDEQILYSSGEEIVLRL